MSRSLTPIGHCSKRLRRKLEVDELMALLWRIKVKPEFAKEPTASGKGGRWSAEANFAVPGPFWNRPTSPEGHVSFHFGITTVATGPNGKSVVADSRGKVSETDRTPGNHDDYVSRGDAVMTIGPAEFDEYASREGAIEVGSGQIQVALRSNISLDPAVRASYWDAVHSTARTAGPDRLVLEPSRGLKKEWADLSADERMPRDVRDAAAKFATGELKRKAEFPMGQAEAKEVIRLICLSMPAADRKKGPVRFARGRKGRTQYRLETELPDGIDNAARFRILDRVAEEVGATGAMYTVTIHAPDGHNDSRNYHLHLVAHDRPAKLIDGLWDFTIATPVAGQSGRISFKERRKKIVIPDLMSSTNRGDFQTFLKDFRARYAEICNLEVRAAGLTRLFDPRRYTEMGIDREPTKPLGTRLAPLEAAGVPTKIGTANAEIIWTYELQTRLMRCEADKLKRQQIITDIGADIDRRKPSDALRDMARGISDHAVRAAALLDTVEAELAEYDVTLAMARARPSKAIETCSRILTELETGGGSSTDRRSRPRIEQRLEEATNFLRSIEQIDRENQKVIVEQQPEIAGARRNIAAAAAYIARLPTTLVQASAPTPAKAPSPPSLDVPREASPSKAPRAAAAIPHSQPTATVVPIELKAERDSQVISLEAVIERITTDRLIVLAPEYHAGNEHLAIGVSRDELRVLCNPNYADRAQEELARIADLQADEIKKAHLIYRSYGADRAKTIADENSIRPTTFSDPLGVLLAYQNHPTAARLMGWELPESDRPRAGGQSFWRRISTTFAGALARSGDPLQTVDESDPASIDVANRIEEQSIRTAPTLDEAIADYAAFIRTDPDVEIESVDGERRVEPSSATEWEMSVRVFEDEEAVKKAVEDRWDEDQRKEREAEQQRLATERLRAKIRAEIEAGLGTGKLVAVRSDDGWVFNGPDEDLVHLAKVWRNDPQLLAAFEESSRKALSGQSPSVRQTVIPVVPKTVRPSVAASVPVLPQATPSVSLHPASGQNYTVDEQQWFLNATSGRTKG